MRHLSKPRQAEARAAELIRKAFADEFVRCMSLWCGNIATDTHEMARGPARRAAYGERCAWLRLCRRCHDGIGSDVAYQLAVKAMNDLDFYDRIRVNQLRGREDDAITEREVIERIVAMMRR
jgi:hypothetical protein